MSIQILALVKLAEQNGIDLDDEVHDSKAEEASEINNRGSQDQIDYLVSMHGVDYVKALVS